VKNYVIKRVNDIITLY